MITKPQQPQQESLIDPNFLFRFSVPCLRSRETWTDEGIKLSRKYLVPSFGELMQRPVFAELRMGWSEHGLMFTLRVSGKKEYALVSFPENRGQ